MDDEEADIRPETFADCLRWVADYLDLSDRLLAVLDPIYFEPESNVQIDLRAWAKCFEEEFTALNLELMEIPGLSDGT